MTRYVIELNGQFFQPGRDGQTHWGPLEEAYIFHDYQNARYMQFNVPVNYIPILVRIEIIPGNV